MSRLISKAEGFELAYEAFDNINFNAYDYYSIKQSMIEYIKLYFPETFNDFIESSEFIALIEIFAYLGELMAYRFDMNAHENIMDFAQRKQSVLRLAKYISYNASRNVPARGLVKLDTITTTERIFDSKGRDLANRVITWDDANNPDWKEQFFLVLGRVLEQDFGSVSPTERVQVNDILFELYPLKNEPLTDGVIRYNTAMSGQNYNMELVPSVLTDAGPQEARPENNARFSLLYGSDGLGDSSKTTGIFIYTKQGRLYKRSTTFDGVLPNQTYDVPVDNINDTDVWVNKIDPNTQSIVDDGSVNGQRSGEWEAVDLANAQNIIFNTNPNRGKYEIETLENDNIRLIFGDGEFADIPSGQFDVWYRTSVNEEIYIPENGVVRQNSSFAYIDENKRRQTFSFTFSLVNSVQNNSPSEDIEHIRKTAPSVYYTQDRMVNGRDYNSFPLQDPSIVKLKTINRTFAGDSNYEQIADPSQTYRDVKLFGDDLAVYFKDTEQLTTANGAVSNDRLIQNHIEPLLSTIDFFVKHTVELPDEQFRREFTTAEEQSLVEALEVNLSPWPIGLNYVPNGTNGYEWTPKLNVDISDDDQNSEWWILVDKSADGSTYTITYRGQRLIAESNTTHFYTDNSDAKILSLDTLSSSTDEVVVLKANRSSDPSKLLDSNTHLRVVDVERIDAGLVDAGLPNLNAIAVSTQDVNGDLVPDGITLPEIINIVESHVLYKTNTPTFPIEVELSESYITGMGDVDVVSEVDGETVTWIEDGLDLLGVNVELNTLRFLTTSLNEVVAGALIRVTSTDQPSIEGVYRVGDVSQDVSGVTVSIVMDTDEANAGTDETVLTNITGTTDANTTGYGNVVGRVTNKVVVLNSTTPFVNVNIKEYVYFKRESITDKFQPSVGTDEERKLWFNDADESLRKREPGRSGINFLWHHRTPRTNLIDPATTNIHDMFVVTRGYYNAFERWLKGEITDKPTTPTPFELRNTYAELLDSKMISDTVIMHSGDFKIFLGDKANPELQAKIKVIRKQNRQLTDNQLKLRITEIVRDFFSIEKWEFGETFYFTELSSKIQNELASDIHLVVLVPQYPQHSFGDLYQIFVREDEIIQVDVGVEDIEIIEAANPTNIKQR
ncbi:MAG: hypothetical protein JXR12_01420 [Neptunomonas phycophila]|uniref:hypothetical protein n=1 Tax=Neptunomonas phycophila TaxID=1572645 RepID=UPI003B8BFE91